VEIIFKNNFSQTLLFLTPPFIKWKAEFLKEILLKNNKNKV
jgi:hypothetical protein